MTRSDNDRSPATPGAGADDPLAAFFAAARAETPQPGTALLSAILADAADASAARARAEPQAPTLRWRFPRIAGGWRWGVAFASCAALGFWLGLSSGVTDLTDLPWGSVAASESVADPVVAFFDLAAGES